MILPFIHNNFFKINPNYKITHNECAVIIDDWYLNYEDMYQILNNMPVARWKWAEGSRNFIDYYDCRPVFPVSITDERLLIQPGISLIKNIIKEYFNDSIKLKLVTSPAEYNYYKNIKTGVSNSLQHFPHQDYNYNAIVYLDKVNSGGTAFYNMPFVTNTEHLNLLHDVSNYPKMIIESAPNRLVIFNGNIRHGGYIEDHDRYVNDWRINQVMLFELDE